MFNLGKRKVTYFLLVGLLLSLISVVCAVVYNICTATNFDVNMSQGNSLIIQMDVEYEEFDDGYPYVSIFANSTDLNCSDCSLLYSSSDGGRFDFTCDNSVGAYLYHNYDDLAFRLDGGLFDSGDYYTLSASSHVLTWSGFDLVIFNANLDVGVNVLVIMVFLLAPTIGLVLLGVGKWGVPIGLTLGAIVCYLFAPYFVGGFVFYDWILYAIILLDVGLFIASWKGAF